MDALTEPMAASALYAMGTGCVGTQKQSMNIIGI